MPCAGTENLMVIRKESKLADLISSSGLVGASCQGSSSTASATDTTAGSVSISSRPSSAPLPRCHSSSARQLSRANSRAATILGLQAVSRRATRSSSIGDASNVADAAAEDSDAGSAPLKRNSAASRGSLAWQDQHLQPELSQQQQTSEQHQQLLRQLERVTQQLAVADATQHTLQQQLQEQAEQHRFVLSDQQAVHDNSSKKLFRDIKAAQAAKEQALAGKRVAEQATRDLQQELAAVQGQCQCQQQQLAALEERCAAAARKLEQQSNAREEASRRASDKAQQRQHQLRERLTANEAAIKAEELLRQELHKRTSTILGLQAKVDHQDAALAAAAEQAAALQGQLQELQSQGSCAPSVSTSQAGDEQLSGGSSYMQQQITQEQLPAATAGVPALPRVLLQDLELLSRSQVAVHVGPAGEVLLQEAPTCCSVLISRTLHATVQPPYLKVIRLLLGQHQQQQQAWRQVAHTRCCAGSCSCPLLRSLSSMPAAQL
ncbi:hypothetical protein COO60DRAFT_594283 [Scenedesmus sp. NREL 46B-D3]|nr:hypothetical protein COO60DRAFT_594283 [Scenedesmus sp. NREL 46B-D3]